MPFAFFRPPAPQDAVFKAGERRKRVSKKCKRHPPASKIRGGRRKKQGQKSKKPHISVRLSAFETKILVAKTT
jgi:hypothetical protein